MKPCMLWHCDSGTVTVAPRVLCTQGFPWCWLKIDPAALAAASWGFFLLTQMMAGKCLPRSWGLPRRVGVGIAGISASSLLSRMPFGWLDHGQLCSFTTLGSGFGSVWPHFTTLCLFAQQTPPWENCPVKGEKRLPDARCLKWKTFLI